MKSVKGFQKLKDEGQKITMTTCYDYWSAQIINESNIDAVLVGDSTAMVMHGFETTVNATIEMMTFHTAAVRRGLKDKFLIADMPFLAHKKGREYLVQAVEALFKAGAQAVKIEGGTEIADDVNFLVKSGIPVMGHLGLTPQSVNQFGGFKIQGKSQEKAEEIINSAKALEEAGCFAIVLEMVPASLAKSVTEALNIPTIGIGAGKFTSGQILVLQDLLGLTKAFSPKFLRKYLNGYEVILNSLNQYANDVCSMKFPEEKESF